MSTEHYSRRLLTLAACCLENLIEGRMDHPAFDPLFVTRNAILDELDVICESDRKEYFTKAQYRFLTTAARVKAVDELLALNEQGRCDAVNNGAKPTENMRYLLDSEMDVENLKRIRGIRAPRKAV